MSLEEKPARDLRAELAGLCVHLFTASGAAFAFLALIAAIDHDFQTMFLWLAIALFVDGVDGTFARALRVETTVPYIDGATLDFVVDFLTYVLVPVFAITRSGLLSPIPALWTGMIITAASALYFADKRMKAKDNWFRGFPALWNVAALYLFVFRPGQALTLVLLTIATIAMFAPIVFVHPMRVRTLRTVTLAMTGLWLVCAALCVSGNFDGGTLARAGLLLSGLYFLALPTLRKAPQS